MHRIKLTQGKYAIVDEEDYEALNQYKWHFGSQGYAKRYITVNGKQKPILMHRILNNTPIGYDTDHINRNRLDNRKSNLRTVTRRDNLLNKDLYSTNTSGYKNVALHKQSGKWRVSFSIMGKKVWLGLYKNLEDAVKARDSYLIKGDSNE